MNGDLSTGGDQDWPPVVFVHGFSRRKRPILQRFLGEVEVRWIRDLARVPPGATLVLWGSAVLTETLQADLRVVRVEDGFLRSVGLGADLVQPLSWVMDRRGIYYDARTVSDLEQCLQTDVFDSGTLARARTLRARILTEGLTKYNVGSRGWRRPPHRQQVILVPGQVETDASIRWGAVAVRRNLELLQAVRQANPDAYLLYKPHPDVVAGLRSPGQGEARAARWCDELITDGSMDQLLAQVDELHTITSLAGFEALIRGIAVTCYGQPFYAGWGLTTDRYPLARRTRCLTIDELVAGALIRYPRYVSRATGRLITPEQALDELAAWKSTQSPDTTLWRRGWRLLLGLHARLWRER